MLDENLKKQYEDELEKLKKKIDGSYSLKIWILTSFKGISCKNDEDLIKEIKHLKALNEFKNVIVTEDDKTKEVNNLYLLMKNLRPNTYVTHDLVGDFLQFANFSTDDIKILAQIDLLPKFIENQDHNRKIDILKFFVELKRADIEITENLSQIIQALSQENFQYFQSFFQKHQVTFKDLIKIENLGEIFTASSKKKFNYLVKHGLYTREWINGMFLIRAFLFFLKENECFGPLPLYLLKKNNFFMNKDNKEFNDKGFETLVRTFGIERNYYYESISCFFYDPIAKYQRFYGDLSKMPNALGIIKFLDKKDYNFLCEMRRDSIDIIKEAFKKQNYINNKGEEISFFERYKKTLLTSFLLIAIDILILGLAIKFEVFSKIEEKMNKFFAISAVVLSAILVAAVEISCIEKSCKLDLEEFLKIESDKKTLAK